MKIESNESNEGAAHARTTIFSRFGVHALARHVLPGVGFGFRYYSRSGA